MRRLLVFIAILPLIGLGLADLGRRGAVALEGMLKMRVENGLGVLGFDWARVRADGLVIELAGDAPDVDAQTLAVEASRSLARPGRVIDRTTARLAPPERREPVEVEFHRDDNGLTLIGRLHDEAMRASLLGAIEAAEPGLVVHDLTGLDAARPSQDWAGEVAVALAAVHMMPRAFVRITPGSLLVEGVAADPQARDEMEAELIRLAGPNVTLVTAIRVPGRVIAPFSFIAEKTRDGALALVACAARTEAEGVGIDRIRREMAIEGGPLRCPVGLGGPHGDWEGAIRAGLKALAALPAGRLEVTYGSLTLDAAPPTRVETFEAALARLSHDIPPGFDLAGAVAAGREAERAAREKESYWMQIVRLGDRLALAGRVEDAAAGAALSAVAAARLGRERVASDLELAGVLPPPGWQEAALAAVDLLAEAPGSAELTARGLSVSARVPSAREARRLHDRVAAKLPGEVRLETRFVVDMPALVAALPLGPERCVAELDQVATARGILFDPGSARMDDRSREAISELAAILRRCPDTAVEIGGHTDNQGREELNERLSQNRADAVLDALVAQGIALGRLEARGYGEHQPVASNDTPEGRARNRRIAFQLRE